jgi:hypothetical protein
VASYKVNRAAVAHAKELIDSRRYVKRSRWADVQPTGAQGTDYLKAHDWRDYGAWHLGLREGAPDETKARYGFVFGDFRRLHRMGLVACYYRAAEWEHMEIAEAAHKLLRYLHEARSTAN